MMENVSNTFPAIILHRTSIIYILYPFCLHYKPVSGSNVGQRFQNTIRSAHASVFRDRLLFEKKENYFYQYRVLYLFPYTRCRSIVK